MTISKYILSKKDLIPVFIIFLVAIIVRFFYLEDSIYFGFDEARDAFVSQSIYLDKHLTLLGPGAGSTQLHHGILFWYLLGPIYLAAQGNPIIVSIVFRILNCLGVFLIFKIGKLLFNSKTGIINALIYAVSFEETQYALFIGNPSLAIISWLLFFLGVSIIYKTNRKFLGLILIVVGIGTSIQLELFSVYTIPLGLILLLLLRKNLKSLRSIHYLAALIILLLILSSYWVAEIKYHFRDTKLAFSLAKSGFSILEPGENKYTNYLKYLMVIFHDNIFSFEIRSVLSYVFTFGTIGVLAFEAAIRKNRTALIVLIWVLSGSLMLIFGGYNMYHMNVGIGLGLIVGVSSLLAAIPKRLSLISIILLIAIIISNLNLDYTENKYALNVGIKPQPYMRLSDEIEIINQMYKYANGNQFTFRVTSMPYLVQTVWAYLFQEYGYKKWGYLPYLETGNTEGYPGAFPVPQNGTTCIRFYIREPMRGIPVFLSTNDIQTENYFSKIAKQESFGSFLLQYRQALSQDCINKKPYY